MNRILLLPVLLFCFHVYASDCVLRRTGKFVENNEDYRPAYAETIYQLDMQYDTNLTLFRWKIGLKPGLELAQSVELDEDKRTLRLKLKKNCGWSDGKPVTAYDMLKGIQLVFSAKDAPLNRFAPFFKNALEVMQGAKPINELGVRLVDDYTLEFDLVNSPDLLIKALTFPAFTPAPVHLMKEDLLAWPVKSIRRVSSGAYQVTSVEGDFFRLKRNPYFCRSISTSFEEVEFYGDNDPANWARGVVMGALDVAHEVKPEQAKKITSFTPSVDITLNSRSAGAVTYLVSRLKNINKETIKLRQAIEKGLDYEVINNILENEKTGGFVVGLIPEYPDYKGVTADKQLNAELDKRVQEAKLIMQSLGYGPNNHLRLEFLTSKSSVYKNIQRAVTSMLNRIYIDIQTQDLPNSVIWEKTKTGDYDLTIATWRADFYDPSNYLEGIVKYFIPKSIVKKKAQQKLEASYQVFDEKARYAVIKQIEKMILESKYVVPLFEVKSYYLLNPGFTLGNEPFMSARNIRKQGCQ